LDYIRNLAELEYFWIGVGVLGAALLIIVLIVAILIVKKRAKRMKNVYGITVANIQVIGSRDYQQDSFGVTNVSDTAKGVLAVVADGMGGTVSGGEISKIVTSHMLQAFQASAPGPDPSVFLLRMTNEAQSLARSFIVEQLGNEVSGSTLVAAAVLNGGLYFVSVGDSRVCLLRNGALIQLNREHTCASQLDERAARGEISFEEARNDPQRNALTSYIGVDGPLQIDNNQQPINLIKNDRILLMSDGVFGTLDEGTLTKAAMMENVFEAGAAIEYAVKAVGKPHQDNYTAILLNYQEEGL